MTRISIATRRTVLVLRGKRVTKYHEQSSNTHPFSPHKESTVHYGKFAGFSYDADFAMPIPSRQTAVKIGSIQIPSPRA